VTVDTRRKIVRTATILVIIFAYGFSYSHGVAWALEHLPEDQPGRELYAYGLALIPEICFVMAVLRAQEDPRDARIWVIGGLSFGWMLWTNGASAADGTSGMVVALLAPAAALLMLWVNGHPAPEAPQPAPAPVQRRSATRVTIEHASDTRPVTQSAKPTVTASVVQPKPRVTYADQIERRAITAAPEGQLAAGIAYVKGLPGYGTPGFVIPTRPVIQEATGISNSTAKRAVAAIREELSR
jgi:hypothetical protein